MRQFSGLVNPPKRRALELHRNVTPAMTGAVMDRGNAQISDCCSAFCLKSIQT
jgi:hypothetical protein